MKGEEKFSDDANENFRIENEILKIKLKAQYGDAFHMETNADTPPEIENKFLAEPVILFMKNFIPTIRPKLKKILMNFFFIGVAGILMNSAAN